MQTHEESPERAGAEPRFGEFAGGASRPMMAMVEITNRCNMDCPVCFSDANNPAHDVPYDEVCPGRGSCGRCRRAARRTDRRPRTQHRRNLYRFPDRAAARGPRVAVA